MHLPSLDLVIINDVHSQTESNASRAGRPILRLPTTPTDKKLSAFVNVVRLERVKNSSSKILSKLVVLDIHSLLTHNGEIEVLLLRIITCLIPLI
jgi:hypothetical protein